MKPTFGSPRSLTTHAERLLNECSVVSPPVPDDRILQHLELETRGFSYRDFIAEETRVRAKTSAALQPGMLFDLAPLTHERPQLSADEDPIRSLLLRAGGKRTLWVERDLSVRRRRTKIFHEVGHDYLPGHGDVGWDLADCRFNVRAIDPWEREASAFAARLLLLPRWFVDDISSMPTGLSAIEALAERYEATLETTAIHYAQLHPGRCLFVRAELATDSRGNVALLVRYSFRSRAFPYILPPGTELRIDCPLGDAAIHGAVYDGRTAGIRIGLDTSASYRVDARAWGTDGAVLALVWQDCRQPAMPGFFGSSGGYASSSQR